jgi:hypothetical protein
VWCREMLRNSPMALRVLKSSLNAVDDGGAGLQVRHTSCSLITHVQAGRLLPGQTCRWLRSLVGTGLRGRKEDGKVLCQSSPWSSFPSCFSTMFLVPLHSLKDVTQTCVERSFLTIVHCLSLLPFAFPEAPAHRQSVCWFPLLVLELRLDIVQLSAQVGCTLLCSILGLQHPLYSCAVGLLIKESVYVVQPTTPLYLSEGSQDPYS